MLWRKFGLAEAKKADEFVKTEDHRRVVLGIARMFNIPVTIKSQAKKEVGALNKKISRNDDDINRIKGEMGMLEFAKYTNSKMKSDVESVSRKWVL
jgi:hypothetical protein